MKLGLVENSSVAEISRQTDELASQYCADWKTCCTCDTEMD